MAGYKVNKLCKMLQAAFPEHHGLALTWSPEKVFPVKGSWRSRRAMFDVRAWEAYATYVTEFGQVVTGMSVGSYMTITELIKFEKLYVMPRGDEVDGYNGDAPKLREYTEFEE
jgi:hypothetical protein